MINSEAFFQLSYGMYIVCSGEGQNGNGFISNAVVQVTADPPKFAVCCNKDNYTSDLILSKEHFSISVLDQETPTTLIGKFGYKSGKDIKKIADVDWKIGETGVPVILTNSLSYIECKLEQAIDAGSHFIFVGEVHYADTITEGTPLTYSYYRNIKKGIAPKNAPTYIDKSKLIKPSPEKTTKHKCLICGYLYSSDNGDNDSDIPPGTSFNDLPDDWKCPICGADKDDFIKQ